MKKIILINLLLLSSTFTNNAFAHVDADPGEVMIVSFNFCPTGWAQADASNVDLQGRVAIGHGAGLSLSNRTFGEKGGSESFTITTAQMPEHNHLIGIKAGRGVTTDPTTLFFAHAGIYRKTSTGFNTLNTATLSNTGVNQEVEKQSPYLTMKICIKT